MVYEFAWASSWVSPQRPWILAPSSCESVARLAGRSVGDILAILVGLDWIGSGAGGIGAGVTMCGTGVLCPAGMGVLAVSGVAVAAGSVLTVGGAVGLGENLARLTDNGGPTSSPTNSSSDQYPEVIDPRTGQPIPAPPNNLQRVPPEQRVVWGIKERAEFIRQWYELGYDTPVGGWDQYDIHHIIPKEYGGTNAFDNLVPVLRDVHQQQLNPWWQSYGSTK
jgi:hypothetical protein